MTPIDVACAADARYLAHGAAMLHSVASVDHGGALRIHFLHGSDIPAGDLDALERMLAGAGASLSRHAIDEAAIAGLPDWGRIPTTMWYRIMLPELLGQTERVLYLDIDTLVLDSLGPLWELELDDSYLAAVTNVPERHMMGHAAELGLPGPEAYFNSGVLLMNLELMRREGSSAALRECALTRREQLLWPDQDTLNLVLGDRRRELHPRWNLMNSIRSFPWSEELLGAEAVAEAVADPAIVHFEGPDLNKPWHLLCDHPLRERYAEHRGATPWPRWRRSGITPRNLGRYTVRRVRSQSRT
jgi:lipopolysaccharide biosynthesis glycosyltransferase